jgi:hypothetical protein
MRDVFQRAEVDTLIIAKLAIAHVTVVLDDFTDVLWRQILRDHLFNTYKIPYQLNAPVFPYQRILLCAFRHSASSAWTPISATFVQGLREASLRWTPVEILAVEACLVVGAGSPEEGEQTNSSSSMLRATVKVWSMTNYQSFNFLISNSDLRGVQNVLGMGNIHRHREPSLKLKAEFLSLPEEI